MENWICEKCGGYIRVNLDLIEIGTKISFSIEMSDSCRRWNDGWFLFKKENYVLIFDKMNLYFLDKNHIYPADAPVNFLYNMFNCCECV